MKPGLTTSDVLKYETKSNTYLVSALVNSFFFY